MQKEKNGREEFKELNIEAVSERWFDDKITSWMWSRGFTWNFLQFVQLISRNVTI